jgi:hypothetical protein
MEWSVIATLIAKYGIPFVDQLIQNLQKQTPPTLEEWTALKAKVETPFDELVPKQ